MAISTRRLAPTTEVHKQILAITDKAALQLLDQLSHEATRDHAYELFEQVVLDAYRMANRVLLAYNLDPRLVSQAQLEELFIRVMDRREYDTKARLEELAKHVSGGLRENEALAMARDFTFLRTEQFDIFRKASILGYRANADIVRGWQWEASLDDRTCRACIAMHGSVHSLDEVGPDGHPNCRCVALPLLKGRDDWIKQDEAQRWFDGLSDQQCCKILGNRGFDQYLGGKYPMKDWVTTRHTPVWRDSKVPSKVPKN